MARGGKNEDIQDDGRKANRGRMSHRQRQISNLVTARDPEARAPSVFPRAGAPYALIEESGVEAKFSAITKIISGGLGNAVAEATTRSHDLSPLRPWPSQASPENQLSMIDAEYAVNEAVINALTAHLVEHLVIREDLRQQAEMVRRAAEAETRRIPEFMVDFASRLIASGVIKGDLRFLAKDKFEQIVTLIRGLSENDAALAPEAIESGVDQPSPTLTPIELNSIESPISGATEEPPAGAPDAPLADPVELPSEAVESVAEGSLPRGSDQVPDQLERAGDSDGQIATEGPENLEKSAAPSAISEEPKGRWDALDLKDLPYEIFERPAVSEADIEALKMRLPEVHSLRELALTTGAEKSMVDSVEDFADFSLARKFMEAWSARVKRRMTGDETRAWIFLLVAIRNPSRAARRDTDRQFAGLVLPGPTGSSKVREIRVKQG